MKHLMHQSAKSSHYNKEASSYDAFNENGSKGINELIEKILRKYEVKSVLDLTCGTGSQVFFLAKAGFEVIGADINSKMLKIAKDKAKKEKLPLKFIKGDMRNLKVGTYDAVITIFNAVGHLTKLDFEEAMRNVHENLKVGGLYIFDIFNLNYLLDGNNITKLTIDWQEIVGNTKFREIQYSTISGDGILASFDTYFEEKPNHITKVSKSSQTLQVYSASQLKEMLDKIGFKTLDQTNVDGSQFIESKSERILSIAKKLDVKDVS